MTRVCGPGHARVVQTTPKFCLIQPPFTARPGTCPENCREKFLPLIPWTIPCKHFTSRASVPHLHSQSSSNTSYVLSWNSGCFKIVVSLSVQLEYQLWHRLEFQLYQYRNFHQELLDLCAQKNHARRVDRIAMRAVLGAMPRRTPSDAV